MYIHVHRNTTTQTYPASALASGGGRAITGLFTPGPTPGSHATIVFVAPAPSNTPVLEIFFVDMFTLHVLSTPMYVCTQWGSGGW